MAALELRLLVVRVGRPLRPTRLVWSGPAAAVELFSTLAWVGEPAAAKGLRRHGFAVK